MLYRWLKDSPDPSRAAKSALIPYAIVSAAFGLPLLFLSTTESWDTQGAALGLCWALPMLLSVALLVAFPVYIIRVMTGITENAHDREATFALFFFGVTLGSITIPMWGLVGGMLAHDPRAYLVGVLAGLIPILASWPSRRVWSRWEATLSARGILRSQDGVEQALPADAQES